jgi:C4-dicarboxylate-specific signal transduction histidine kinase
LTAAKVALSALAVPVLITVLWGEVGVVQATNSQTGDEARHSLSEEVTSQPRQLLDRLRFILAVIAVMAAVFVMVDLVTATHRLGAFFAFRVAGVTLATAGFVTLRQRWFEAWAWPATIAIVTFAYLFVAAAGLASPTGEYVTTAILFVGAALLTATVLPWGWAPQCFTVTVGALVLAAAIIWKDGSLGALATDPGAVVSMGFVLSGVIAREFEQYRAAHRRELEERRHAEAEVRQLNAVLEQRVAERTATLQSVNDRLASEIAERRRVHEALRSSERLLADTVNHSSAIVSLKDVRGYYLLINEEFERRFSLPRQSVVGSRDEQLFGVELAARMQARDGEVLATGVPISFEQNLPMGDETRSYVCVKFPLHGADGTAYGVGSMATDITAVKQLQEALRRHQDELARVLRLHTVDEMTAAVAHEINQPLCAITNYAQGAVQRLRAGDVPAAALLDAFERIATEGLRAGQILRSIRDLIRRDNNEETTVDVRALAGEAVRVLEPEARLHNVTVRLEAGEALPPVRANAIQIEQVLVNLMLNGVQAVATDDRVQREVVVATTRSGDSVEVAVTDSGGGIAADVADKLFSPFVTTKARGLGLGLAISRSIVENHGGRLWAASLTQPGTTFRFSLPLADGLGGGQPGSA